LATFVFPIMGGLSVADVDTALVLRVLQQPVEGEKGKRIPLWNARSETASRLRGRIESTLNWAKARGMRTGENPAQWRGHLDQLLPVRSKVRGVQHHPALPYGELPDFIEKLRSRSGIASRALEFTVLTVSRTNEALGAHFDEFDLGAKLWTVPSVRMKTGREHRVPLSTRAVAIVKDMAAIRQSDFVFLGAKQGQPLSQKSLLMLLHHLHPDVTTHGFRSTFKDWCAECTHTPNFVSEAALAHVVADKVEAAYRRADLLEKRRSLMEDWARYCWSKPTSAKVVPLQQRRT
jgi:integrase